MNLVIGMGEVGKALATVLDCPGRDVRDSGETGDVLHIAIPYSESFVRVVGAYEQMYQARQVVIHSTVPVGTCDPHRWVHSPVRGRHPALVEALETFPKLFGGHNAHAVEWPGIKLLYPQAALTEAGKLWELAQFGLQVRVTQAIYDWCISHDLDPDIVYRAFAETYNDGYSRLGPQFVRPVLEHMPGPIGGHCVTESMALLNHQLSEVVRHGFHL